MNRLPPIVVTLIGIVVILLIGRLFPSFQADGFSGAIATYFFIFCGAAILIWSVLSFRKEETTVDPLNPEGASTLVVAGPYRFTRNPMYLAMVFWLWAAFVFVGNWAGFVVVISIVLYFDMVQIAAEEKVLREKFGDEFEEYSRKVRKWI